eukprot:Nk52_evm14s224 gene=Nk52_evmTU14s224
MSTAPFKILCIGPQESGKTTICNALADISAQPSDNYLPTHGVRIMEFEDIVPPNAKAGRLGQVTCMVELWDCEGGMNSLEMNWPAYSKDALGIMCVVSSFSPRDAEKEAEEWLSKFAAKSRLSSTQLLVFNNIKDTSIQKTNFSLRGNLSKVACETYHPEDIPSAHDAFRGLLSGVHKAHVELRDKEELGVLNR